MGPILENFVPQKFPNIRYKTYPELPIAPKWIYITAMLNASKNPILLYSLINEIETIQL